MLVGAQCTEGDPTTVPSDFRDQREDRVRLRTGRKAGGRLSCALGSSRKKTLAVENKGAALPSSRSPKGVRRRGE